MCFYFTIPSEDHLINERHWQFTSTRPNYFRSWPAVTSSNALNHSFNCCQILSSECVRQKSARRKRVCILSSSAPSCSTFPPAVLERRCIPGQVYLSWVDQRYEPDRVSGERGGRRNSNLGTSNAQFQSGGDKQKLTQPQVKECSACL